MLNIKELEKRWLKYKIKSLIPYISIFVTIPLIIFLGIILLNYLPIKTTQVPHRIIEKKKHIFIKKKIAVVKKKIIIVKKKKIKKEIQLKHVKSVELRPSLGFMKRIQNSAQPYYDDSDNIDISNIKKQTIKPEQIIEPKKAIKQAIIKKIQIQNTRSDIKDIIKRFKKNSNPALSLFVAKKEYQLKNYNEAYNYALITNKLNHNIEDSWIIFAKSLVKLGKKSQAISTLKNYIKYSHSTNAQVLLSEIQSGKFI